MPNAPGSLLDSTSFPHILDAVLYHLCHDPAAARNAQQVCKTWKHTIALCYAHISIVPGRTTAPQPEIVLKKRQLKLARLVGRLFFPAQRRQRLGIEDLAPTPLPPYDVIIRGTSSFPSICFAGGHYNSENRGVLAPELRAAVTAASILDVHADLSRALLLQLAACSPFETVRFASSSHLDRAAFYCSTVVVVLRSEAEASFWTKTPCGVYQHLVVHIRAASEDQDRLSPLFGTLLLHVDRLHYCRQLTVFCAEQPLYNDPYLDGDVLGLLSHTASVRSVWFVSPESESGHQDTGRTWRKIRSQISDQLRFCTAAEYQSEVGDETYRLHAFHDFLPGHDDV